ncbi:MAG: DUF2867 domain-containing protein [Bradyrhizobium sp.]|nr:DUF2867 domain-containing protein [Bradyrhizobium sp.]
MTVREITPAVDTHTLLPGAQFADAYCIEIDDRALDARQAAERMMARQPRWAEALVTLRNLVVTPFGLKTSGAGAATSLGMIGIFPVISETPDRLVAGFNDKHLDFRVMVDIARPGQSRQVSLTTLVHTHNWLGRTYLAIIMPFHRLIAPALLRQVAG